MPALVEEDEGVGKEEEMGGDEGPEGGGGDEGVGEYQEAVIRVEWNVGDSAEGEGGRWDGDLMLCKDIRGPI